MGHLSYEHLSRTRIRWVTRACRWSRCERPNDKPPRWKIPRSTQIQANDKIDALEVKQLQYFMADTAPSYGL